MDRYEHLKYFKHYGNKEHGYVPQIQVYHWIGWIWDTGLNDTIRFDSDELMDH